MAAPRKKAADTSAKAVTADIKDEAVQAAPSTTPVLTEAVKESAKEEAKKEPVKRGRAAKKLVEKPEAEKKTPAKRGRVAKADLKREVHIQYDGKSYSEDDLIKIAKDVWKFDLKQKASALNSIDLYVKPEENVVYYVMNKEFTGHFSI